MDNQDMMYGQQSEPEKKSNSSSVLALIMGILSILFCCCSIIGIIPAIVGIIFAGKAKKNGEQGGMATAGLVCSIIGLVFGILATVVWVIYGVAVFSVINEWNNLGIMDQVATMNQDEIMELMNQYLNQ